ncbi:hypothetical protein ZTR_03170 [Talaromyces verruculosus]|nr:hypothetical protein ZTR_03170 [Talaromyces verruculosus]
MMRQPFHKDNRKVPLGMMLLTFFLFLYYFGLDRVTLDEARMTAIRNPFVVKSSHGVNLDPDAIASHADKPTTDHPVHDAIHYPDSSAKPPSTSSSSSHSLQRPNGLTANDVVLMFKTGATVLWKRVPIHLTTTFSTKYINSDNILLYSDYPETIGRWEFIDILSNTSEKVRNSAPFQLYLKQEEYESRQNYAELSNMPGDGEGPIGGWRLDSYKFLPIIQHAGRNKPNAKWYIFMEDDCYIFFPNLIRHLENFDHKDPWYLGHLAWTHGDYFAHGGSGFALSRGAWERSFGKDPLIVQKFEAFSEDHGCGDHILGHVLHEYGVEFGETRDNDRFRYGFNAEAHWSTWYERVSWCKPVYSWHHTHGKDVARFYNIEQSWDFGNGPLRYRDIYKALVAPYLRPRIEWWDNQSSKYKIDSSMTASATPPSTVTFTEVWRSAWKSVDACEAACKSWADCVQWAYYDDLCKMDNRVLLGNGIPEGDFRRKTSLPWVSGWLPRRIENWECEA